MYIYICVCVYVCTCVCVYVYIYMCVVCLYLSISIDIRQMPEQALHRLKRYLCSASGSTHIESGKLYRKVKHRARPKFSSR